MTTRKYGSKPNLNAQKKRRDWTGEGQRWDAPKLRSAQAPALEGKQYRPRVVPDKRRTIEDRLTAIEALLQVNRDARPVDVGAIGYLRRAGL